MLAELCRELKNYFDENSDGTRNRSFGTFTIVDGAINLADIGIKNGQYFRIVGSLFNDGVYKYPASGLTDESFDGAVWLMAVPPSGISLAAEIRAWQDKYGGTDSPAMSPYNSESFGGYSYSKSGRTGSSGSGGDTVGTWQGAFANRLNQWRKIRE